MLEILEECWLVSCSGSAQILGKKLFKNKEDALQYYNRTLSYSYLGVKKDEVLLYKCKLEIKENK